MSNDETKASVRLHGETYSRLKSLKDDDETIQEALEKIASCPDEEIEVIERPEDEVVAIPADESVAKQIRMLAGENTTANDVVDKLLDMYEHESE
jgi:hypothetical protein